MDAVNDAINEAAIAIRELGMDFIGKELEEIISKPLDETEDHDDDDNQDDDDNDGNGTEEAYTKEETFVNKEDLFKYILMMQKAKLIEEKSRKGTNVLQLVKLRCTQRSLVIKSSNKRNLLSL